MSKKESFEEFKERIDAGAEAASQTEPERSIYELPGGVEAALPGENTIAVQERLKEEGYRYTELLGSPSELPRYRGHGKEDFRIVCIGDVMSRKYMVFKKKKGWLR